jgi:hypothetical protein
MLGSMSTDVRSMAALQTGPNRQYASHLVRVVYCTRRSVPGEVRLLPHELYHNGE